MREEQSRRRSSRVAGPRRRPTKAYAEFLAAALLAKTQMRRPPVDVEFCARSAGIQLLSRDPGMGQHSALLSVPFGIPSIAVNAKHPATRQRFSIAHEIGHWVLEREPGTHELRPIAARGRAMTMLERVCDHFAVNLLMPEAWVRDRISIGMTTAELARVFQVSWSAMSARLRELGVATQPGRPK